MSERPAPSLFVGIGSPHGNDRLGWAIADELAQRLGDHAGLMDVRKAKSPVDLLDWLDGRERVFLCDACRMHLDTGTIRCWEWPHAEISRTITGGSVAVTPDRRDFYAFVTSRKAADLQMAALG